MINRLQCIYLSSIRRPSANRNNSNVTLILYISEECDSLLAESKKLRAFFFLSSSWLADVNVFDGRLLGDLDLLGFKLPFPSLISFNSLNSSLTDILQWKRSCIKTNRAIQYRGIPISTYIPTHLHIIYLC